METEVIRFLSTGDKRYGEGALPVGEPKRDFYTPLETARLLQVPLRSVLEWLKTEEVEAELDPINGRWKISKASLKGFESVGQTDEELAWRYEKERLLAELHAERERADRESDRADRERSRAERERDQAERLRRELEIERMKGGRWKGGTADR